LDLATTDECFPGFARMIEAARKRNDSPAARRMFDVYRSWMYVSLCNQAREGYLVVFVNDIELGRARAAVKATEKRLKAEDPALNLTQLWDSAGEQTKVSVAQDQCRRTLFSLLEGAPGVSFDVQRP
jgi:hypothetical protein